MTPPLWGYLGYKQLQVSISTMAFEQKAKCKYPVMGCVCRGWGVGVIHALKRAFGLVGSVHHLLFLHVLFCNQGSRRVLDETTLISRAGVSLNVSQDTSSSFLIRLIS